MSRPEVLFSRVLQTTALLAAPAAAVMLGLVLTGTLAAGPAILGWLGIGVGCFVMARAYLTDVAAVAQYVTDLSRHDVVTPPVLGYSTAAAELSVAIARLSRSWSQRNEVLAGLVAANETILNGLADPLVMIDKARRVVRANLAARTLFGERLDGHDLSAVLRFPPVLEAADGIIAGGKAQEVEVSLPVPVERHFSVRLEPLTRPTNDGIIALISLHDLTAIRRSEQMRADFVANASHELRTPLSALIGFIETLRGPAADDSEAQERFLAIMHDQASRMARLVEDLLSLSRIELDEHTQPTGRVNLHRLLQSVVDPLVMNARARDIDVELDVPPGLEPVIGDSDQLMQVFQNLIDNALKYGRPRSTVRVAAWRREDGMVAVSVQDEGEGIAREHLPRLTERFYRVDSARSRKMGGTGLGLAIAKHVINRHRGSLAIESLPGKGSTFTVTLPTLPSPSPRAPSV